MKNIVLVLISLSFPIFALSQDRLINQLYLSSGVGVPSDITGKTNIAGTPFLDTNWTNAIVKTKKGEFYKGLKVKFSAAENQLFFLGENNMTMKFIISIEEFSLLFEPTPQVFKSGFPKIANFDGTTFYQILAEGKISLLKKVTKRVIEEREYNSAITTRKYVDNIKYFLFDKNEITEIKSDKKFMSTYFSKSSNVDDYVKENNINFKNESHLINFVNYFNK